MSNKDEGSYYVDDYNDIHEAYTSKNIDENRFVKFEDRQNRSVVDVATFKVLCQGKYQTNWRGVALMKGPFEIVVFNDFFIREKPATVIELGSYTGGSALWMADTLKCFGVKSHVYSVDCNFDNLHELAKASPDITFIKGDLMSNIEDVFPEKMLKEMSHPWFITEDCHVNLDKTLPYLERFMKPGDYLLVEDTHPNCNSHVYQESGLAEFEEIGDAKLKDLAKFLKTRSDKYLVDCHYNDFFGYNAGWNMNSFLKKI